jgi:hypothetical protein
MFRYAKLTTEIISKPFYCEQKGFLHSNQDCTRAITQQFYIGLTIERGNLQINKIEFVINVSFRNHFCAGKEWIAANVHGLAKCGYSIIRLPGTVVDFLFKVQDKIF